MAPPSDDGTALYVVNYDSDTMTKVRTSDLSELQSFSTAERPVGITYDSFNDEVWVSAYSGVIHVYAETEPVPEGMCTAFGCNLRPGNDGPGNDGAGNDGAGTDGSGSVAHEQQPESELVPSP